MIACKNKPEEFEREKLLCRREGICRKLKQHFSVPVSGRDYREFDALTEELEEVRKRLEELK